MRGMLALGPLEFGLIIGGAVLVLVFAILYVLVFHKMLMRRREQGKVKKEKKQGEKKAASGLASDLFKDMQEDAKPKEKETIDINALIDTRKNAHINKDTKEAPKPKKKKDENDKSFNVMDQFG